MATDTFTWKEFKDKVESSGITDESKIWLIEVSSFINDIQIEKVGPLNKPIVEFDTFQITNGPI